MSSRPSSLACAARWAVPLGVALVAPAVAGAQLQGRVVAAAGGRPVPSALVTVRRQGAGADTAVAATARTDTAGAFRVRGLKPGRYAVRVRAFGFAPLVRQGVEVAAGNAGPAGAPVDLGPLALAQAATQLGNVQVTGERDATELAPDRNSFNTKDLPAAAGGTAVDVLRNVPAVEVDGDNNVSLRGNGNVVVQINGRPTPLRGQQLGNYLAQLPANLVAKVEVATNPSARNDPDGASGVINIVLNQRTDLGTSGGFTAATATTGLANLNGNLGRQSGPWTGFVSYGLFRDRRPQSGSTDRFDTSGAEPAALLATLGGYGRPLFHNATLRGERKFGRFNALSADAVLNGGTFLRANDASYSAVGADGDVDSRFVQRSAVRGTNVNQDYVVAWRRTVDAATNVRSAELRFNDASNHFRNTLRQQPLALDGTRDGAATGPSRDEAVQRTPTWRAQTDWTRGLTKSTKLEAGAVGILRRSRSTFERANAAGDDAPYVVDATRNNGFTYREQVAAAYGVLSQRAGPFELQGGLRLERATTRLNLAEPVAGGPGGVSGQQFRNRYSSAFPNALVAYNVSPKRQLKASYSRRISRPDPGQLNPFVQREDAFNTFQGNPSLRPEYTDAYELGYQHQLRWGSVQIAPFYRRTPDAVRYVRTVDTSGVARASFANVALSEGYGADVNLTVRAGRLTLFGGGSGFGNRTNARNVTPDVSFASGGWSARGNATLKLSPLYDLSGFAMYRAPQATEAGRQLRFAMTTFALKRKLKGDAATLTLRAQDPFNMMGWGVRTTTGPVVQVIDRRFGARALNLAFNYTFGQAPRLRPPAPSDAGQQPQGGAPSGPPG